jgi:rare lipoprotein A
MLRRLCALSLLLVLAACASQPKRVAGVPKPPVAAPGAVKIGKPYQVFGRTYVPADDRDYDERGIASWYGPTFHAKPTATGEIYNQDDVTAAHKTLPMPSWVEVTNLDNGRQLVVRVNDRGPFVDGRIIDLSRRSAQLLGVDGPGLARVRVKRVFPEGDWTVPRPLPPVRTASAPPAPVTPPVTPPLSTPAAASYIQVAALSDEGRARALASVLADFGPAAAVPTGTGLWRVRIGPVASDLAGNMLWDVQTAGYADARIVQ